MKRGILLTLIAVMAITLIAAAPNSGGIQKDEQRLCRDLTSGKLVPCPKAISHRSAYKIKIPGQGEPTMEKVTYFHYLASSPRLWGWYWRRNNDILAFYSFQSGCLKWYWYVGVWKVPVGCNFRYQY